MAIVKKFEVTISSGGTKLQEYDVALEDQPKLSNADGKVVECPGIFKYIEAIPGANFEINYSMKQSQSFGVSMDTLEGSETVSDGKWSIQRFRWEKLSLTDEKLSGQSSETQKRYTTMGIIRIEVWQTKFDFGQGSIQELVMTAPDQIPEVALKGQAVELGIGLDQTVPIEDQTLQKVACMGKKPLAVFAFLYRSKNALQILGIIPRNPEPVTLEDRDPATLTPAELLELVRRQQAQLQADKVKIKQEKVEANLKRLAGIKREAEVEDDDEISIVTQTAKKPRREVAVVELSD